MDAAARSLLSMLNDQHLKRNPSDSNLSARIASYELAARMQLSVPKITDLSTETAQTLKMYGADSANENQGRIRKECHPGATTD